MVKNNPFDCLIKVQSKPQIHSVEGKSTELKRQLGTKIRFHMFSSRIIHVPSKSSENLSLSDSETKFSTEANPIQKIVFQINCGVYRHIIKKHYRLKLK